MITEAEARVMARVAELVVDRMASSEIPALMRTLRRLDRMLEGIGEDLARLSAELDEILALAPPAGSQDDDDDDGDDGNDQQQAHG